MDKFFINHRVTYKETDKMGVAYYSNYLVWFEICRTEYFREKGYPYLKLEEKNIFLPVVEAYCRYKSPVTYDDEIKVCLSDIGVEGIRLKFTYLIKNKMNEATVAKGCTTHVFIDKERRPLKVPPEINNIVEKT
ncbi:acyl-CoA thioesterase [Candidatus Auribacterota bacterium]